MKCHVIIDISVINFTLQALSCKRHNWKYFDSNLASLWAGYM